MTIHCCSYHIDFRGKDILKSMAQYISLGEPNIIDMASFGVPENNTFQPDDIVFIYGDKAARQIDKCAAKIRLVFPDIHLLDKDFGDQDTRESAFRQLQKLKSILTPPMVVTPVDGGLQQKPGFPKPEQVGVTPTSRAISQKISAEDLPQLSTTDLLAMINTSLVDIEWLGITKDGKTVRLSKEIKEKKADIDITFIELYMLKLAIDTLQISEVEIVANKNTRQSSTQ